MQKGIDVSSNNHPGDQLIDWQAVAAFYQEINPGVRPLAIIKATEGNSYYNPWHALDVARAREAGFDICHYHYGLPSKVSGGGEALTFLAAISGTQSFQAGDEVALDIEDPAVNATSDLSPYALAWRSVVRKRTYQTPLLYSNESYLAAHNLSMPFMTAGYRLWLAAWQDELPSVPAGWSEVEWWQHTDRAAVPGIPGPVDADWVIGRVLPF